MPTYSSSITLEGNKPWEKKGKLGDLERYLLYTEAQKARELL